jgi:hypothetical protein
MGRATGHATGFRLIRRELIQVNIGQGAAKTKHRNNGEYPQPFCGK